MVIPTIYDWTYSFEDELAEVMLGAEKNKYTGKYGVIDKTGIMVIPTIYDYINYTSSCPLIRAKLNGKWGYIDKQGNSTFDFQ